MQKSLKWMSAFIVTLSLSSVCVYSQAGKSLVINHFVSDPAVIEGHLVVADVDGTGGSVNIAFYDQSGSLAGRGAETIPAHGKINVNPEKYVQGMKMIGTVRITSSKVVTGQYWQFYKDRNETWKNTTTIGFEAPGFSKLACPHFVSDNDVEAYLVFASSDGKDTSITINFYDDA